MAFLSRKITTKLNDNWASVYNFARSVLKISSSEWCLDLWYEWNKRSKTNFTPSKFTVQQFFSLAIHFKTWLGLADAPHGPPAGPVIPLQSPLKTLGNLSTAGSHNGPVHKGTNHVPKAVSDRDSDPFLIWKPDFTLKKKVVNAKLFQIRLLECKEKDAWIMICLESLILRTCEHKAFSERDSCTCTGKYARNPLAIVRSLQPLHAVCAPKPCMGQSAQ